VQEHYRGHEIRFVDSGSWSAMLVETASGTLLPTKATASISEGISICSARARLLVDRYLDTSPARRHH
jgi:hypothetical protein